MPTSSALMRIGEAFDDFRALWNGSALVQQKKAKDIKSTRYNPRGDLYEPVSGSTADPLEAYYAPCGDHDHYGWWESEVNTKSYGKKNPSALVVGNPEKSYIWQAPKLKSERKIARACVKTDVESLLGSLRSSNGVGYRHAGA